MIERAREKRVQNKLKSLRKIRDEKKRNKLDHSKEDRAISRLNKTNKQIKKDDLGKVLRGQRYSRERDKATRRDELKKSDDKI
jgi:hypothetical protein